VRVISYEKTIRYVVAAVESHIMTLCLLGRLRENLEPLKRMLKEDRRVAQLPVYYHYGLLYVRVFRTKVCGRQTETGHLNHLSARYGASHGKRLGVPAVQRNVWVVLAINSEANGAASRHHSQKSVSRMTADTFR
jgi:hypothetical protein